MTRARAADAHDIQATLKKLKDQSNAKEIELIELISSIYETVKQKQDQAVDAVQDAATDVNTSVHLHPWRYIAGAALAGFLAGMFVRR